MELWIFKTKICLYFSQYFNSRHIGRHIRHRFQNGSGLLQVSLWNMIVALTLHALCQWIMSFTNNHLILKCKLGWTIFFAKDIYTFQCILCFKYQVLCPQKKPPIIGKNTIGVVSLNLKTSHTTCIHIIRRGIFPMKSYAAHWH